MVATVLTDLVQVLNPAKQSKSYREWAKIAPLLAALIAPVTSLLDIPALTQNWYSQYGLPVKDFTASIVLSAIGLVFNLFANGLLVVRFSADGKYWELATKVSLGCWIAKTILAVTNLAIFGIFSRNAAGFHYEEGFWCAVVSVCGAGIISLLLLFHYIFQGDNRSSDEEAKKIRVSGRHFMLSIISLITLLALEALIFSKIEGWAYLDGIYFSVVSMLTIGFGDFEPTQTATRILLFPFAVLTIAQLANQVGMIIEFFGQRSESRKTNWRLRYEALQDADDDARENSDKHNPDGSLKKEVDWLTVQARREQNLTEMYDLAWSLATLIVFWLVGGLVFSHLEGWPYGDGVYFCYVIFLAIGYGDFVPGSAAGRVVFIVYSLMAVPVVASFAVQTVTRILGTFSARRLQQREAQRLIDDHPKSQKNKYLSHGELCLIQHRSMSMQEEEGRKRENDARKAGGGEDMRDGLSAGKQKENDEREETGRNEVRSASGDNDIETPDSQTSLVRSAQGSPASRTSSLPSPDGENAADDETIDRSSQVQSQIEELEEERALKDIDKILVKRVLQLAVELETQARILLLHALPKGSDAELLLRADARLQHREVNKLHLEDPDSKMRPEGLVDITEQENGDIDIEDRVRRYRELFAALLASGSKLQRLEGVEQLVWERRTKRERQIAEEEAEPHPESRGRMKEVHDRQNKADDERERKKTKEFTEGDVSDQV